ncbi:MAG: hypothetical protein R6U32_06600 [Candidatus Woesearchaeota archaeon]
MSEYIGTGHKAADEKKDEKNEEVAGRWFSVRELAEEIGCSYASANNRLNRLYSEGLRPPARFDPARRGDMCGPQPMQYFISEEHIPYFRMRGGKRLHEDSLNQRMGLEEYLRKADRDSSEHPASDDDKVHVNDDIKNNIKRARVYRGAGRAGKKTRGSPHLAVVPDQGPEHDTEEDSGTLDRDDSGYDPGRDQNAYGNTHSPSGSSHDMSDENYDCLEVLDSDEALLFAEELISERAPGYDPDRHAGILERIVENSFVASKGGHPRGVVGVMAVYHARSVWYDSGGEND